MKRIIVFLVGALIGLAILIAIAPFLLIGALLTLIAAWQRPALVERVSSSRRLVPVPATVRSTPMRFASSLVAVTVVLTGASMALAKPTPTGGSTDASPSPVARASVATPTPTASPTARPTVVPTASPTSTLTPQPTPVFGREPTGPTQIGQVVNVVDGDTIDVMVDGTKVRVRYIGMDTPETHNGLEWLGPEASAANSQLVMGREVVLEKDVSETDQYGRALRYVWLHDGATWTLVNLELIELGFAAVMRYPPDVKYIDPIFVPAEQAAQAAGTGRWAASPTPVPTAPPRRRSRRRTASRPIRGSASRSARRTSTAATSPGDASWCCGTSRTRTRIGSTVTRTGSAARAADGEQAGRRPRAGRDRDTCPRGRVLVAPVQARPQWAVCGRSGNPRDHGRRRAACCHHGATDRGDCRTDGKVRQRRPDGRSTAADARHRGAVIFLRAVSVDGTTVADRAVTEETVTWLPGGQYTLQAYYRTCDGNCGLLDPATEFCHTDADVEASGSYVLTVEWSQRKSTCTFGPRPGQ